MAYHTQICQTCEKAIEPGDRCIRVSYGKLRVTAHPHVALTRQQLDDYFCSAGCVAIRDLAEESNSARS